MKKYIFRYFSFTNNTTARIFFKFMPVRTRKIVFLSAIVQLLLTGGLTGWKTGDAFFYDYVCLF